MTLSVIIPAYNEAATLAELLCRVSAVPIEKEIIVVDDGSTDSTGEVLRTWESDHPDQRIKTLRHPENLGKGAAIANALPLVTGELVVIQDADLEYDPGDYRAMTDAFSDRDVKVVYGSRNLQRNPRSSFGFYWGGRALSWVVNLLYGSRITDEATGYKMFDARLLKTLGVESRGFEFCPEITAKVLRQGIKIHEVPVSYQPRSRSQGKKITWRDGLRALWVLIEYRFRR